MTRRRRNKHKPGPHARKEIIFGENDEFCVSYQKYPFGKEPWKFRVIVRHEGEEKLLVSGKAKSEELVLAAADKWIEERLVPMLENAAVKSLLALGRKLQYDMIESLKMDGADLVPANDQPEAP